jgi:hypothetical protein
MRAFLGTDAAMSGRERHDAFSGASSSLVLQAFSRALRPAWTLLF